jgi:hypothetical protein
MGVDRARPAVEQEFLVAPDEVAVIHQVEGLPGPDPGRSFLSPAS